MEKTARDIIAELEKIYSSDEDAMEVIETAKRDIEYIQEKENAGGYTGQSSIGKAQELRGFLEEWY